MEEIVAERVARRLADWGVEVVFGLPGDGINGLMEGFRRLRDRIEFVLVHHEEAAAFMATGYAKATGRLGVCCATSGPGAIHLLNGLYDAKLDQAPVLALTGMQETAVLGTGYQQEVHLDRLYVDVADYDLMVTNPQQIPTVVDLAIRNALAQRTVAHLTFPNDIQVAPAGAIRTATSLRPTRRRPRRCTCARRSRPIRTDIDAVADVLQSGTKVAMLVGAGALDARDEVRAVAELLARTDREDAARQGRPARRRSSHAPVGIGLLGTRPSEEVMESCDTLLMVGTSFPYTKHLPEPGQVKVAQLDIDPTRMGLRLPIGRRRGVRCAHWPAGAGCRSCDRAEDRTFLESAQADMDDWRQDMAALVDPERFPIAPQYLMGVIDEAARDDAILTCDSGTIATWAARHWTIRGDRRFFLSGQPGHHGARSALRHRHPARLPGPPGHRVRRRRRVRHVDGGVPHRRAPRLAGQGRRQQQQLVRPDPVGADRARLPGVRGPPRTARGRLRGLGHGVRRLRGQGRQTRRAPERHRGAARSPRAGDWSTATSIPTSRRCRPRSPTNRPRRSPRPSCTVNRTRRRSLAAIAPGQDQTSCGPESPPWASSTTSHTGRFERSLSRADRRRRGGRPAPRSGSSTTGPASGTT